VSTNPTYITAPDGTPFIEVVREFDAPGTWSSGPRPTPAWSCGGWVPAS
jgi:hypothetical protein